MIALVVENTKPNHDHHRIFDFVSINRTFRHTERLETRFFGILGFRTLIIHHAKKYIREAVGSGRRCRRPRSPRGRPEARQPERASEREREVMMMMPFNCSYRNKNEPTAIYPSLGREREKFY
jgi:hypothetical protein